MQQDTFADILNRYVERAAYTPGQLARLSGLPKSTIVNWTIGRVQHPRDWQPLLRLLGVLRLSAPEADRILRAAGHPVLDELRVLAAASEDETLFRPWQVSVNHSQQLISRQAPFQAVADTPFFVGRDDIRRQLREQLQQGGLCALIGMPGVGKTTLATKLAYDMRSQFPDGVLWAQLSASDPMSILHTFAAAFGVDLTPYGDLDSRGRVLRSLLADRRVLIVLDDVQDDVSVQALLPPSGPCAMLLTTRKHNLPVTLRAKRFTLAPFAAEEEAALQLFAHFLGHERTRRQAEALARLAHFLGHLPLALAIAAGRLAWEPGWSAHEFLERLQTMGAPLQALEAGSMSVQRVFHTSFTELETSEQRLFAALACFEGDTFSSRAAASLIELPFSATEETLRRLHALSLLQAPAPDGYRLHPLLHQFAAALPQDPQTPARLLAHVAEALDEQMGDDVALSRNLSHYLRALKTARNLGDHHRRAEVALNLAPFLLRQGRLDLARDLLVDPFPQSLPAALRARRALYLAQIARLQQRHAAAERFLAEVQALHSGEPALEVALLTERGTVTACRGDYRQAYGQLTEAREAARRASQPATLITLLKELGATCVALERYDEAESCYQEGYEQALAHAPRRLPSLLRCLGSVALLAKNDLETAAARFEEALASAREFAALHDQALILNNLAVVSWHGGDDHQANDYLEKAQVLADAMQLPGVSVIIDQNSERLRQGQRLRLIFD